MTSSWCKTKTSRWTQYIKSDAWIDLWHIHWRMPKLTSLTITALRNVCAVHTDTPKKQFSCYCSIKHLSGMRRRVHHCKDFLWSSMCDGWVLYLPVQSSHYWIRSCVEGWLGCCGDRNIDTLMHVDINAWEQKLFTMTYTPITEAVSCSFYDTKERGNGVSRDSCWWPNKDKMKARYVPRKFPSLLMPSWCNSCYAIWYVF